MPLSEPRAFYSIQMFSPFSRTDGTFFGNLRVLGEGSVNVTGELVSLNGGANKYEWHVEEGLSTAEVALTMREYPDFVYELFLGKAPTTTSAEAAGDVGAMTNKKGTSAFATTGMAAPSTQTAADLKFGHVVVVVKTSTTVDVLYSSDIDFNTGTDGVFIDDAHTIASGLTIVQSSATLIPNFGINLNGDSGVINMSVGDTAEFDVRAINTGTSIVKIGALTDVTPEFGAYIYAKKRGNFEMLELLAYRLKASGMSIPLSENTFAESAVTAKMIYDSTEDALYQKRFIKASA